MVARRTCYRPSSVLCLINRFELGDFWQKFSDFAPANPHFFVGFNCSICAFNEANGRTTDALSGPHFIISEPCFSCPNGSHEHRCVFDSRVFMGYKCYSWQEKIIPRCCMYLADNKQFTWVYAGSNFVCI